MGDKVVVDGQYLRDTSKQLADTLEVARQFVTRNGELMAAADVCGNLSVRQQLQSVFAETGKAMVGLVTLGESITITLLYTAQLWEDADRAAAGQYQPPGPYLPPEQYTGPPPIDMTQPLG